MAAKILILSASVGAGHLRAAQALENAFTQHGATVRNIDILTLTSDLFKKAYSKTYMELVNRAPHVVGYFYDLTDKPANPGKDGLRALVQKINLKPVQTIIASQPWDCIVSTHFLPADLIATMRRTKKSTQKHVTVVTDFDAHALWVNQPCDRYYVATEDAAASLQHWGVPIGDISTTGIPIMPAFSSAMTRDAAKKKLEYAPARPVILLLGGGFGLGPIERAYNQLLTMQTPVQITVICGKSTELKEKLEKIIVPPRLKANIVGFTPHIDEYMRSADIVVTKPGGLTSAESLACGAAVAIMNPIPGQESRNSDYLLENGAAIKINSIATMATKIERLLKDQDKLNNLRKNALVLAKPKAATEICESVLAMCK